MAAGTEASTHVSDAHTHTLRCVLSSSVHPLVPLLVRTLAALSSYCGLDPFPIDPCVHSQEKAAEL